MSSSMTLYDRALAQIADFRKTRSELKSLLDYYGAVLTAQKKARASLNPDLDGFALKERGDRNSEGLPLLEPEDIRIDWSAFDQLLGEIIQITARCADSGIHLDSWCKTFSTSVEWRDSLLPGFLRDKTFLEQAAGHMGADLQTFTFLNCQALIPFMEAHAQKVRGNVDEKAWQKGCCPVCGAEPLIGKLEKESGKRHLQCHLCRTDWPFRRIECPFCGNDDQQKLRYFYDEQDKASRVDVCDCCNMYLKTVDTRQTDCETMLLVENVMTLHLDIIAQREGFHRHGDRVHACEENDQ